MCRKSGLGGIPRDHPKFAYLSASTSSTYVSLASLEDQPITAAYSVLNKLVFLLSVKLSPLYIAK